MKCDKCQGLEKYLKQCEMPLMSINPCLTFEIWAIDFVGTFPNLGHRIWAKYIIIEVEYVTKWEEAHLVESYTKKVWLPNYFN